MGSEWAGEPEPRERLVHLEGYRPAAGMVLSTQRSEPVRAWHRGAGTTR